MSTAHAGRVRRCQNPGVTQTADLSPSDQQLLRAVTDRQAITDQIHRYCRAMDRIDAELGYSVWHNGAEADYGAIFRGTGHAFIDWVCEVHRGMEFHTHRISNISIELDGDTAGSESYVMVTLRFAQRDRLMQSTSHGRYVDRWSRHNGRWAIDRREYVQDFDDLTEVTTSVVERTGRRDRHDPSYAVLAAVGDPRSGLECQSCGAPFARLWQTRDGDARLCPSCATLHGIGCP